MSSWPSPQKMSQKKVKVPAFSGVIVTRVSWSGTMSVRMPKSGILKPWMRSIEVSTNVMGWPRFTFTVSGVNSNFEAWIETSPGAAALAMNTAPSAALLPISSAMKSLRFMELGLGDRQFGDRDLASHGDVARAERLQRRIERRRRRALGCVAGGGLREDQRLGRMMGDVAGHVVVLLMDVAVEHHDVLVRHQQVDRLGAVGRGPVPVRHQVEQRAVGQHDDAVVGLALLEVGGQPRELLVAQLGARVGDVVERDEVHALVVERVVRRAKELLEGGALVERGVVLAGQEAHVLDVEGGDDFLEALHARAALGAVLGRVGQVTGEDDEVGLLRQAVHRDDGLFEGVLGVGIGRALVAPMGVRDLDEMEVAGRLGRRLVGREQACSECDSSHAGELEKVATVDRFHMNLQRIVRRQYRACVGSIPSGIKSTVPRY